MGKLGDLWVRLGLKSDDYKKGIDKAKKETKGFGSTLANMKAGAMAIWAAIGASVVAFGQKMIETTNAVGDKWALFTAQANAGWNTFVQSLSAMKWDNFIGRFKEAVNAAKELQNALDAEFEINNSIRLQKAAMAEELSMLEVLARDATKPYEERAKAAQRYLDLVKPLYDQELALANKLLDAQQGAWLGGSGLSDTKQTRDDLAKFLVDYGKTNNGIADAINRMRELQEQYDMALSVRMKTGNYTAKNPIIEEYRALRDFVKEFGKINGYQTDLYKLAQVYETLRGDADTMPLVDALIRAGEAAGAYNRETKKIQSSLNSSLAQMTSDAGKESQFDGLSKVKSAHEIASKLGHQIANDLRLLDKEFSEIEDIDIDMSGVEAEMDAFLLKFKDETMRKKIGLEVEWIGGDMPDIAMGGDADISKAIITLPKMDTSSLEAGIAEIRNIIGEYESLLQNIESGHIELPPVDIANLEQILLDLQGIEENFQHRLDVIAEMNAMLEDAIVSSITNGIQAITDAMFSIEGADWKSVLAAFIAPLGDTLKQMGAMIMAEGVAMEAFKKSFTNPAAAIAAGAALMAIGSMVSSGLQSLISNPGNGGGSAMSYGGSSGGAAAMNYESTLTVEVTGKISGNDIVLSGKKTNDKNSR